MTATTGWTRLARSRAAPIVVVAAVLAVYLPGALSNGLVSDDLRFIRNNAFVTNPDGIGGWLALLWDPRTVDPGSPTGIVRPLRTLEFALDHAWFRLSPTAFHVHSLLWHALASVLALRLLRRLVKDAGAALAGALVWALHPMHTEAVAWISSRGDVAMGACVLGALLFELRSEGKRPWLGRSLGLLLGLVAMLYKETAVVLPLLVFAVRLAIPVAGATSRTRAALRRAAPWLVVSAIYLVFRSLVQVGGTAHADTFVLGGSTAGTFATMFRGIGVYLTTAIVPVTPAWDWYLAPATSLTAPSVLGWLVVHVALIATAVRLRERRPLVAVAVCLFYFPLIPVANWPFALGIPTAERFLYLPLLGLAVLVARGLVAAPRATMTALVAAGLLGVAAFTATERWADGDTLIRHAMDHGTSARAHATLSADLRARGVGLRRGVRDRAPQDRPRARAEADRVLEEALDHAHQALDLWHRAESVSHSTSHPVVVPHVNAADLCLSLERPGEALWHAELAIAAGEDLFPESHFNRARALIRLRRGAGALRSMERAVELGFGHNDPASIGVFRNAGELCLRAGQYELARVAFTAAGDDGGRGGSGLARVEREMADILGLPEAPETRYRKELVRLANGTTRVSVAAAPGSHLFAIHGEAFRGETEAWQRAVEALGQDEDGSGTVSLPVSRFWRAICLEELGQDDDALIAFESIGPVGDSGLDAERIRMALGRLRSGCPAWRDRGPGPR